MMLDLNFEDTRDIDYPAKLTENLSYQDLVDSQDQCISVQYNEIDLGDTALTKNLRERRQTCILKGCVSSLSRH